MDEYKTETKLLEEEEDENEEEEEKDEDEEEETKILKEMQELSKNMSFCLHNIQNDKTNILRKVVALNNTYFTKNVEILEKFNKLFNSNILDVLLNASLEFSEYTNEKIISNCCPHEYIDDLIDIDVDRSLKITYCHICEVTKIK